MFVKEYLVDLNATRAAMRAGYSKKTAEKIGSENLKKPGISVEIQKEMDKRAEKVGWTGIDVLRRIKEIADVDISECYDKNGYLKDIHEIPIHVRKAIAAIETVVEYEKVDGKKKVIGYTKKIKFWDKTKTLELYGINLKLFTDKHEVTGKDGEKLDTAPRVVVMLPAKDPVGE